MQRGMPGIEALDTKPVVLLRCAFQKCDCPCAAVPCRPIYQGCQSADFNSNDRLTGRDNRKSGNLSRRIRHGNAQRSGGRDDDSKKRTGPCDGRLYVWGRAVPCPWSIAGRNRLSLFPVPPHGRAPCCRDRNGAGRFGDRRTGDFDLVSSVPFSGTRILHDLWINLVLAVRFGRLHGDFRWLAGFRVRCETCRAYFRYRQG